LPTQKSSSGIATLAAGLAARGLISRASLVTYLVQTNQMDKAYEVAKMIVNVVAIDKVDTIGVVHFCGIHEAAELLGITTLDIRRNCASVGARNVDKSGKIAGYVVFERTPIPVAVSYGFRVCDTA